MLEGEDVFDDELVCSFGGKLLRERARGKL